MATFTFITTLTFAQSNTQTIRGIIRDKQTKQPLVGASIAVLNTSPQIGNITNENGAFELKNLPAGRVRIQVQFIGYQSFTSEDIILLSTKEQYL